MSLNVARRLKKRTTARAIVTTPMPTIWKISLLSNSAAAVLEPGRSRKGCNSSRISVERRVSVERVPSSQGCRAKAQNRTAKGGQYSAMRLQRAVIIIKALANSRKNSAWCERFLSDGSKARYPTTIAVQATKEFPRNSHES